MKKRYRLVNRKRFFSFLFLLLLFVLLTGSFMAAAGNVKNECQIVTIRQGDTLWSIAQEYSSTQDIRKYIYDIKKVNQLESATVYPGQKLYLP